MIGRTISHYRIQSTLGKGGMGIVYKAEDIRLGRSVAIKFAPESMAKDRISVERLQREARAVSVLNHPNVCTLYDIGEADGHAFIVMECLEGQTLRERIAHKPMPVEELIEFAIQTSDALDSAHARGVIHRDIKPGNLYLTTRGDIKVMDFGLAKFSSRGTSADANSHMATEELEQALTNPGSTLGTVCYMSPEQARGEELDGRTDIFSLGVVLYEMATGVLPFQGNTTAVTYVAILHESPPPPSMLRHDLPPELERIILKALEKKKELRYQSAAEIRDDLKRLRPNHDSDRFLAAAGRSSNPSLGAAPISGSSSSAPSTAPAPVAPSSGSEEVARAKRQRRWLAVGVLALVAVGATLGGYFALRPKPMDSLAVLPFENATGDAANEYLSDGISESVINSLSQLSKLSVRSFSSVRHFKQRGVPPETAGRELKVRAVLTGRLVKRGEGFGVSAELINVDENRQMWGSQYNPSMSNLQSIQDQISREISDKLRVHLSGEDLQRMAQKSTRDSAAYQLYLQGRFQWNKRTLEGMQESLDYFQQAIVRDPDYALAYAGQADAYALLAEFSVLPAREVLPKLEKAAQQALQHEESLSEAHTSLAWARFHNWDWPGAQKEFKRAIELNNENPTAHAWYGEYLIANGRFDEAQRELARAVELNPVSPVLKSALGYRSYFARQFPQAVEQLQKVLADEPSFVPAHVYLGRAWLQSGRRAEAIAEFRKALELSQGDTNELAFLGQAYAAAGQTADARKILSDLKERSQQTYVQPIGTALIYSLLGEKNEAFDWLQRAFEDRSTSLVYLKVDPAWDTIRNDPRFAELQGRVGLR
jgi:serine/threonine-protein kinase